MVKKGLYYDKLADWIMAGILVSKEPSYWEADLGAVSIGDGDYRLMGALSLLEVHTQMTNI